MNKTQLTIIARNFLYYDVNAETGNDIAVWGIGHEKCFPDKHEGPKIMQCYSLHLILKGSGTLIMKGETYQIHQGQIFVISPNEEVEYYPESNNPWEYVWINFSGPMATKLCFRCGLTAESPVFASVPEGAENIALNLVELHKMTYGMNIAVTGHLYNLFSLMIETICKEQSSRLSSGETYVLQAIRYIQENYADPGRCLKDIAGEMGLNYNYASQLFKKVTGITFVQYLNVFRIQRACEMLDAGNRYIKDVAEKVGFTDQLYFSKIFKKMKNTPPKNYNSTTTLS